MTRRILFERAGLRVGVWRLDPRERPFTDTGPAAGFLLVFPRTSVVIQHAGRAPVVADPTRVMFYNRGQEYRRRALSHRGDACEFFSFPAEAIAQALEEHDPAVVERADRPFTATHASIDAGTYLLQRRVVEHLLAHGPAADTLFVEEAMARLLARAVGKPEIPRPVKRPSTAWEHRAIADACRALVARRLGDRISLSELARELEVSPFHLARVFQRDSGTTVHGYRHALRLRTALERVTEGEDLTTLAVDLGYTSHSHFTSAFRRAFGMTPSAVRRGGEVRARF